MNSQFLIKAGYCKQGDQTIPDANKKSKFVFHFTTYKLS